MWILFDLRLYHDWQPEVSAGHKINKEEDPTVEAAASNPGGEIFLKLNILNSIFTIVRILGFFSLRSAYQSKGRKCLLKF